MDTRQDNNAALPSAVRRLALPESEELTTLSSVFEDLQHVLRCCEHLVTALAPPASAAPSSAAPSSAAPSSAAPSLPALSLPAGLAPPPPAAPDVALVEALWTSALVAYARCFSAEAGVLTAGDLEALDLPGDLGGFHDLLLRLRDHYVSPDVNPRETFTIGGAQAEDGSLLGVAVVSAPQPAVDDPAVRQLGLVAYRLSGLVDGRMQEAQRRVLGRARELTPEQLSQLPLVSLAG